MIVFSDFEPGRSIDWEAVEISFGRFDVKDGERIDSKVFRMRRLSPQHDLALRDGSLGQFGYDTRRPRPRRYHQFCCSILAAIRAHGYTSVIDRPAHDSLQTVDLRALLLCQLDMCDDAAV